MLEMLGIAEKYWAMKILSNIPDLLDMYYDTQQAM